MIVRLTKQEIGEVLRLTRQDYARVLANAFDVAEVSQAQLARAAGTSTGYLSRVLNGTKNLTFDTYGKIVIPLGLRVVPTLEPIGERKK